MVVLMAMLLSALTNVTTPAATAQVSTQLPVELEAGHFFAIPATRNGQTLRLIVDTGGGGTAGLYWITTQSARRLGLTPRTCGEGGNAIQVVDIPAFAQHKGLPDPLSSGRCGKVVMVINDQPDMGLDGMIGGTYLLGHVWTFDYPHQHITVQGADWQPDRNAHATSVAFQRDANGRQTNGFARITMTVDGQPFDVLLDTGATAHPTAAGEKISHTPVVNGYGVTSYITTSMLDRWHKAHPDWTVVAKGDDVGGAARASRIIEVPKVTIDGWSTGPVWFTEQPDYAFHNYMASMMDKPTEGTVGGNILEHFVMTIDYPHATVYLRCANDCDVSTSQSMGAADSKAVALKP
jgi:predicted aspartyl protease